MLRALDVDRQYVNHNVKTIQNSFDPIRIRLRVMPVSRAPLVRAKNSDYYFIEAGKNANCGAIPDAIELLKRGLAIKDNHFLCRFNHGVIMFKIGLIEEASNDFMSLTTEMPGKKDAWVYFNLATCFLQMGKPLKPVIDN